MERPARLVLVLVLGLGLAACEDVEHPCRFSFASVELASREDGEVRFGVRDARGVTVALEGMLTLDVREHAAGQDEGSARVLCTATVRLPRTAYRGEPLEAGAALHFEPPCERAAPGASASATLELVTSDGHRVRWAGLGGPFTAWVEPE